MGQDNMEPGRELDAEIAEKVMGWSYETFPDGACPEVKHWYATSPCPNDARDPSFRGGIPLYSEDISDAWDVVEKLWDESLHVQFSLIHQITAGGWIAEFPTRLVPHTNYVKAKGDTAPHSICLAALQACG